MDFPDFGKYLVQQRELRGLSRDDVSRETKIPPSLLMALETGQAERLPSRIFVINFLKAYANVVGLEQDEVLLRYEEVAGGTTSEAAPESKVLAERKRKVQRIATVAILAALAAAAALWILKLGGG